MRMSDLRGWLQADRRWWRTTANTKTKQLGMSYAFGSLAFHQGVAH